MMLYQRFGQPRHRPAPLPYFGALVSGALLVLCFPKLGLYPLAWVALAPFLLSLWELRPSGGFKAGFLMGLPYFFGTQYWIYHSISAYGGVNVVASLGTVLLLAMYLSLYTAVFGALFAYSIKNTNIPAMLLAPVYWVVLEFLRAYAFTGFPWSSIGYSQYPFTHILQIADLTGVYGVSFLVLAVNGAIADVFITRARRREMPLAHIWPAAVGFLVLGAAVLATLGYGEFRLTQERPGKTIRVSIVQGAIEQDQKWAPAYQRHVLDTYEALSVTALEDGATDLLVWPETALPFYWKGPEAALTEEIKGFAQALGVDLLFGAVTLKDADHLGNSAVLLGRLGQETYKYDKIHLVPFGEYVPLGRVLFFINRLTQGIGSYGPGDKYTMAKTHGLSFGTIICYEVLFPGLVRKFFRNDGDFIVNITNDAWFGRTSGPYQHFSLGVLRAIENRKPLVRAANSGISGFIDSSGRVQKSLGLFERGVLTHDVRTDSTRTFYTRFGDMFIYLCFILTIMMLAIKRRT